MHLCGCLCPMISIHALREEGDVEIWCKRKKAKNISIHALREEGDRPYSQIAQLSV